MIRQVCFFSLSLSHSSFVQPDYGKNMNKLITENLVIAQLYLKIWFGVLFYWKHNEAVTAQAENTTAQAIFFFFLTFEYFSAFHPLSSQKKCYTLNLLVIGKRLCVIDATIKCWQRKHWQQICVCVCAFFRRIQPIILWFVFFCLFHYSEFTFGWLFFVFGVSIWFPSYISSCRNRVGVLFGGSNTSFFSRHDFQIYSM